MIVAKASSEIVAVLLSTPQETNPPLRTRPPTRDPAGRPLLPRSRRVAARYIQYNGYYFAVDVYDFLLGSAHATGAPIYNVETPEYWM
jgi:hypothetical protein